MPCSLLDLSPELHIQITNELLGDIIAHEAKADKEDDPYDYNPEEPDEKQERLEHENHGRRVHDLLNWSCTSRFFRNFLLPYAFETVHLSNTDQRGSAILALSESDYRRNVKELVYVGTALGDAHASEKEYSDIKAILSRALQWNEGLYLCAGEETDEDVKQAEGEIAWRALMAETWKALANNQDTKLKTLGIKKLGPINISTFSNPEFHRFLGQFERFHLSIYGEDDGAGRRINQGEPYETLMAKLDIYFFDHLTSVTDFVLKAPEEGPLGLNGQSYVVLALKRDQMPALKTIYLEYLIVGEVLVDFLVCHEKMLESLRMKNCSADVSGLAVNGLPWSNFFGALNQARFKRLVQFELLPDRVPLTSEECFGRREDERKVPSEAKQARQILKDDPSRRLFAYTTRDDKYDMVFEDDKENVAAFNRGKDQAGFDKLMKKIEINLTQSGNR